jgi:pyrimidine-specific ribonucleoside hydrolase
MKTDILLDIETADPDDVMMLCLAAGHSQINLRAVTVTPGTNEQIGLVKHLLRKMGINVPVGSHSIGYDNKCVSGFHYKWLGSIQEEEPDGEGYVIIMDTLKKYPDLVLLTGAPLKNLSKISDVISINKWVAQGGFAGDNVVPEKYRLVKFAGKITCPTYNFNGDPKTALKILTLPKVKEKYLVSKNVCHGIVYDKKMHKRFSKCKGRSIGLDMVIEGMQIYLAKKPEGKKFHDPLALAVLIDASVCEFKEVEMFRQKDGWGAQEKEGTNTFISINADKQKMVEVLTDESNYEQKNILKEGIKKILKWTIN